ncbi:MAG: hypothetical protein K2W96_23860 [Gemmataceae bacterium]|nr:hypothetical protein [Gemmataceae bacterium]
MPHLVNPLRDISYAEAIQKLEAAHAFLVLRAGEQIAASSIPAARWGIDAKRLDVDLDRASRPKALIGKVTERFGEIVNMTATIERMLALLRWLSRHKEFQRLQIIQCHPSTSDDEGGNDLVLATSELAVVVRCEVCDVASRKASSNGKEASDLLKLGCESVVPQDGVTRFICTAREFAEGLSSTGRHWWNYPYRYELIELGDDVDTCLLRIVPPPVDGS